MAEEIERKWRIDTVVLPDYPLISQHRVEQAYLSVHPEVRIRNQDDQLFTLTIKGEGDIRRREIELPITGEQYREILTQLIRKEALIKDYRRYRLPGGLVLELSNVDNLFCYAEVEFPSLQAAEDFVPLPFFREEMSLKMKQYWVQKYGE